MQRFDERVRAGNVRDGRGDGLDARGRETASGVYVYRMDYGTAGRGSFSRSMKFVLVR